MGTFVAGNDDLFEDKVAAPGQFRRAGWSDNNIVRAADVNALKNACYDLRTYATGIEDRLPFLTIEANASATTIQGMADDLYADHGGGVLRAGPGTWDITSNISLNGGVRIEGASEVASVFRLDGGHIRINGGLGIETLRSGLSHLTLDGLSNTAGQPYGLVLGTGAAANFKTGAGLFQALTVKRCSIAGVNAEYAALCLWLRCTFESCADGFWAPSTYLNGCTTQTFIGTRFASNRKRGLFVEQADTFIVGAGSQVEDNGEEGALFKHPGTAEAVFRNITIEGAYVEDNGSAGAFADVKFETPGAQSIQNVCVRRNRFQGSNPDGNIVWQKIAGGLEEDNEFSPVGVTNNIAQNTAVCFVHSRNSRLPSTMWTLGAAAPTTHERRGGDGTVRMYWNDNGTMRLYGTRSTTATTVTHTIKDEMVHCSASGGAVTVNLVSAATVGRGYKCTFIKTDSSGNAVVLDGSGSETINGAVTHSLGSQYTKATLCSDGTNWLIVG